MRARRRLLERLDAEDAEHFAAVRRAARRRRGLVPARPDAGPGPRLLHAHPVRVLERCSGRAVRGRRGRPLRRLMEQLDGPATPACGWAAGVERMVMAAGELPVAPPVADLYVAIAQPEGAPRAFQLARDARRAGLAAQLELSGRSLKRQLSSRRPDRSQVRGDRRGAGPTTPRGDESRRAARAHGGERDPDDPRGEPR